MTQTTTHTFADDRYQKMQYRRCGRSGLQLPAVSLGAWETYGGTHDGDVAKACMFRAFDLGITHFDLANNYGTPAGNAETVCGRILKDMPRDELIISSKAGYRMWPGPYGEWGSRKYIIASCDQSLKRTGLPYFDIFYSHRPDPNTPFEETLGALDTLVKQGKALYVGLSSYTGAQVEAAHQIVERDGLAPITIHQPYYNMLGRTIEADLLPHTDRLGIGVIAFCPLASGLLSGSKYQDGIVPADTRPAREWASAWVASKSKEDKKRILNGLNALAHDRGQTLAQMAVAWVLRHKGMVSAVMGASRPEQVEQNVAALAKLDFSREELARIDALTA
ncbi:MAG: L-glyceraldehyde 3-phosphate reductase [Myxococcales bacterium]|nr:L-glyceraldehyde 3-phosphate reductase [Myxococcales bacterium]